MVTCYWGRFLVVYTFPHGSPLLGLGVTTTEACGEVLVAIVLAFKALLSCFCKCSGIEAV